MVGGVRRSSIGVALVIGLLVGGGSAMAQDPTEAEMRAERESRRTSSEAESQYYKLITLPLSDDNVLEVGGLAQLADGRIMAATRRGDVYIIENAYSDPPQAVFKPYASGLGQPLGLLELDGWIYFAQRGELSRMRDIDGDDRADVFETVTDDWAISGNYHEYAFGPRLTPDGKLWVTLNRPFDAEPYGRADWRGWAVRVDRETGKMEPVASGLRSPAGVEVSPWGDVFYTDNQGEWNNASKLSVIEVGDFHGHPFGIDSAHLPESLVEPLPVGLPRPGTYMKDLKDEIPHFKMPAVWFPYVKLGQSPSGLKWDTSGGAFGPFDGQLFVGDQHHAMVMRVFLEEVNGHWQGAAFRFRQGLQSGVIRLAFGRDHSMFVGMSSRGWGSLGPDEYGLQRLVWTGTTPFEVDEMRARPDGFELTFTQPVNQQRAADRSSYRMESYTYRLSPEYGGPEDDKVQVAITSARVAADGMSVRLMIDPIRAGYVHELHLDGVRNQTGAALLHKRAFYTLVEIPE
jgi:glucose/arabinose dehydrogenase